MPAPAPRLAPVTTAIRSGWFMDCSPASGLPLMGDLEDRAAVDTDDLSGDVARLIGAQERDQGGDVLTRAETSRGNGARQYVGWRELLGLLLRSQHRRVDDE